MVDKGLSVALMGINGIVALGLLVADRVHAVPFEQQVDGPRREDGIAVAGEHVGRPARDAVVVTCGHIEI